MLTHGNGPQVGNLLVKNEIAAAVVPPVPLDWCGAQTQATIGVLILNALDAALARRDVSARTAVVVSRTLVDPGDRGFADPTKPIGRYLPAAEAAELIAHGQTWRDFGARRVAARGCLARAARRAWMRPLPRHCSRRDSSWSARAAAACLWPGTSMASCAA